MADEGTFLKVNPANAGYGEILAEVLLQGASRGESGNIETALRVAAEAHNDEACLKLTDLLYTIYDREERLAAEATDHHLGEAAKRAYIRFQEHLERLYWLLPGKRPDGTEYSEREHGFVAIFGPTLEKIKLRMLDSIIRRWMPELTDKSLRVFRFVINAHSPGFLASLSSKQFEGKLVSGSLQDEIEKLVRGHMGAASFSADQIAEWLMEEKMPAEIREVLVMSRAKRGGWELAKRDIQNATLLEPLDPSNRSPEAIGLFMAICKKLTDFDLRVAKLLEAMQPTGCEWQSDQIGVSEYVRGRLSITYGNLPVIAKFVGIAVALEEKCWEELGRDIFGRARRHIETWIKEQRDDLPDLVVQLTVRGGTALLELAYSAKVKP